MQWFGIAVIVTLYGGLVYSRFEVMTLRAELDGQWERRVAAAKLSDEQLKAIPEAEKTNEQIEESSLRLLRLLHRTYPDIK